MNIIESIRKENNNIVTAAIYIYCCKAVDAEKVVSEQLDLIHQYADKHEIIIVDSYIDRDSSENYNKILFDVQNKIFDIILVCGNFTPIAGATSIIVIDVLI